ncbi:tetratricopeptide repeat-containing sensor histidine kinase [Aquimarina rhabdastrellae]
MKYYLFFFLFISFSLFGIQKEENTIIKVVEKIVNKEDSITKNQKYKAEAVRYKKLFNNALNAGDSKSIIEIGSNYQRLLLLYLKRTNEAKEVLEKLEEYCLKVHDDKCLAVTQLNFAYYYQYTQDYIKAIKMYKDALDYSERTDDWLMKWYVYTFRGQLFEELGDKQSSRKDLKKALHIIPVTDSSRAKGMSYINLASSFSTEKKSDSLIFYSRKSLESLDRNKESRFYNMALNNIAWGLTLNKEYEAALTIIESQIDFDNIDHNYKDSLFSAVMHTLGIIYRELGDLEKSVLYLKKSLNYYLDRNELSTIILTYNDLAISYERANDLSNSLKMLKKAKEYEDIYEEIKFKKEIAKLKVNNLLEIKNVEISNLEKRNSEIGSKFNKIRFFTLLLISLILILIGILFYRGYTNKIKRYQLNHELSLIRLKSLRTTMNPHFLFNSFSTLQNLILKKEHLKANEYMTELSGLIRSVLSSSDSVYIALKEELQILKAYINIEMGRFDESFNYQIKIDDHLLEMNPKIPSMMIQPYIENAIIHGFSDSKINGFLKIIFELKEENIMLCVIEDNGMGRSLALENKRNKEKQHLSIATRNTDERLKILDKLGNGVLDVIIEDLKNEKGIAIGTKVKITLPIISQNL